MEVLEEAHEEFALPKHLVVGRVFDCEGGVQSVALN